MFDCVVVKGQHAGRYARLPVPGSADTTAAESRWAGLLQRRLRLVVGRRLCLRDAIRTKSVHRFEFWVNADHLFEHHESQGTPLSVTVVSVFFTRQRAIACRAGYCYTVSVCLSVCPMLVLCQTLLTVRQALFQFFDLYRRQITLFCHIFIFQCIYTRQLKCIVLIHTVQHSLLWLCARFDGIYEQFLNLRQKHLT